jgi:hypothetical protein
LIRLAHTTKTKEHSSSFFFLHSLENRKTIIKLLRRPKKFSDPGMQQNSHYKTRQIFPLSLLFPPCQKQIATQIRLLVIRKQLHRGPWSRNPKEGHRHLLYQYDQIAQ